MEYPDPALRPRRPLLSLVLWLGVWQLGAFCMDQWVGGQGNELLLPYPITVLTSMTRLSLSPLFWHTVLATLIRILSGTAAGILLGVLLAVMTWQSALLDQMISPAIRVIRTTPVTSFILLLLLWTTRGAVPGVIVTLMVLPVVWENLFRGLSTVDLQLLELARAYRFSPLKALRLVYLPSLRSYILSAVVTSVGLAWKSGVAAEVLTLPRPGIGTQIYNSKLYLEIPDLFAWTGVVILLSLMMERLLAALLRKKGGLG